MRPDGLTIEAGGTPSEHELAALGAALTALVEEERAAAPGPMPAAYRSAWRRAGVQDAVDAGTVR